MDSWLTIFLTFMVSLKVQSQLRLVVNTTCLELAKPSSQQFRLTCTQYDYHCLLDETFTKEFEVCREWMWIPEGNCAYFNSYNNGNIDGRPCISSANLFCPNVQYSSADTIKYSTCYMQKNTFTIGSTTSSYRGRSTSFPFSETTDKKSNGTWMDIHKSVYIAIAFGLIILSLSIAVMCFRYKKVTDGKKGTDSSTSDEESDDRNAERHLLTYVNNDKLQDNMTVIICVEKEDDEQSTDVLNNTAESLQMKALTTDKQSTKLYNLCQEGLKISQEVMEAIITRMTEKSVQELVADETVMNTLAENLPEEFCYPNATVQRQKLFIISYSLLRIYLDEKYPPNSGWGNPVNKKDIGIGDDIERLHRIHSIVLGISDPVTVSVESYVRLLDIMIEALTRLDSGAEFKEHLKALAQEITCYKINYTDKRY